MNPMDTKYPRLVSLQQRVLALLRIYVGLFFLYSVSAKLSPTWVANFQQLVNGMVHQGPPGFYADFLREVVMPAATPFALVVILAELAVGICLTLGLFTAPVALLGAFMDLNFLLATLPQGPVAVGMHVTLIAVQLLLAFSFAGTTWGLDRNLVGKAPWWCQGLLHYEYREF